MVLLLHRVYLQLVEIWKSSWNNFLMDWYFHYGIVYCNDPVFCRISLDAWNCDKLCMQLARAGWLAYLPFRRLTRPQKGSTCLPSVSTLDLVKFTWNYAHTRIWIKLNVIVYEWSTERWTCSHLEQLKLTEVWWTLMNSEVLDVGIKFSSSILQYDVEFGRQRCAEKWTFVDVRLTFRRSRNQLDDSQLTSAAAAATAAHTRRSACCCYHNCRY